MSRLAVRLRDFETGNREQRSHDRLLVDRVDEMREEHGNPVHFAAEESLGRELRDHLRLRNAGESFNSKSARISRRVRERNCRAFRPTTT